jgi:hypothetical protein
MVNIILACALGALVALYSVVCGVLFAMDPKWTVRQGVLPCTDEVRQNIEAYSTIPLSLRLVGVIFTVVGVFILRGAWGAWSKMP